MRHPRVDPPPALRHGRFRGVLAYKAAKGTAVFRLQEHTDRLFNSAHIFQMKMPYDKATLIAAQLEVCAANKLDSCYIRPICFYGSEAMGIAAKTLSTHVAIAAWPWAHIWVWTECRRHTGQNFQFYAPPRQRKHVPRKISDHLRQFDYWRIKKPPTTTTTKRCCLMWMALLRKAPAKISYRQKKTSCTRLSDFVSGSITRDAIFTLAQK